MPDIGWGRLFQPTHTLLDEVVRGSLVYLALFTVLRVMQNRQAGSISLSDLLLVSLTTQAFQNSMIGEGKSLTEGAVVAATIFFWSHTINWLAFRFPNLARLVKSPPQAVIENGRVLPAGLRHELLTRDDLMAQLREQGIDDVSLVQRACVESNGALSVITKDKAS
jgi:uncharacterized membrane protein YcaP (DUF421 family)